MTKVKVLLLGIMSCFCNASERTFKTSPFYLFGSSGSYTASVTAADVDKDGDMDIIESNGRHWAQQDYLYLNLGNGKLPEAIPLGKRLRTSYRAEVIENIGEKISILSVHDYLAPSLISLTLQNNVTEETMLEEGGRTRGSATGDINNDGLVDLIVARRGEVDLLYLGEGSTFRAPVRLGSEGSRSTDVVLADIDDDKDLDIIIARRDNQPSVVMINDRRVHFTEKVISQSIGDTRCVAVGDLNNDGHADVVLGLVGKSNKIYVGNSKGDFQFAASWGNATSRTFDIALADIDKDNRLDIIAANDMQPNQVFFGQGNLKFEEFTLSEEKLETYGVAIADMNGDDFEDIIFANSGEMNEVFINVPAE